VVECVAASNVIDQQSTRGTAVVSACDRAERFLTGSIPRMRRWETKAMKNLTHTVQCKHIR
jgi:hypothetical protein